MFILWIIKGNSISIHQNNSKDRNRRFQNDNYKEKRNASTNAFTTHVNRNSVFYVKEHDSEQCSIINEQNKVNAKKVGFVLSVFALNS